ncbi:RNA methyltransferase [Synechococcus sp. CB0101]|jgi:tRNA/rRNA methyltransferase|uniref:RNA methyltransferase n=1 Tax=Synechococcus sp. CB0101 TaxID=232348 RepID=UPI0002001B5A|nr:RNA methyltransferase [Synechococcus sp. CB0101]QCH15719.1 RNA methyltransferase [Synechococcus sp. CB0101]
MSLAVVLVEPAGPLNVGSVARLCANFAIDQLRLVAPRCDHLGAEARQMAVHGEALLEQAQLYPDLAAAIADCQRVVATSGRIETESLPLSEPAPALRWLWQGSRGDAGAALVFGREDRGLSNAELLQAGRLVRLATSEAYASLNLSHAVAICLHELQACRTTERTEPADLGNLCERGALEATLADAEALLLEVGFLYPHTAAARMAKLRALLQRAQVQEPEVALLRGMVRQLRWAARQGTP